MVEYILLIIFSQSEVESKSEADVKQVNGLATVLHITSQHFKKSTKLPFDDL